MGRSARIAVGAVAAALAAERVGGQYLAAAVALAVAGLLLLGELGTAARSRPAWPVVVGAGLIAVRLAFAQAGPTMLAEPPPGEGPWELVVVSTGSPREGHQSATLSTPPGAGSAFVVAATLPRYPEVVAGDRVAVEGRIRPRPPSAYGDYLARIGAVGTLTTQVLRVGLPPNDPGRHLEDLRRTAGEALARVLPEPEAGLAAGILVGLRDRVDRDLAAAFTTAGVSHVVAISGWNIAIVAAAVAAMAGRLGRRRRSIVTMLAIAAYVAFAGASASVVRAALMAGVVLLARETGRAGRAAAALGWAAVLLLLADPRLIGDAGFQLSSLATAGLIAWATPLADWIESTGRGRVPRWLAESLGVSLAAQAATLPVVLVSFGRLAILAPAVNLAVVPLVAPAMAVGLVALAGGVLVMAGAPTVVGAVLAAPGWVVLRILDAIVTTAASVPFASLNLTPPIDAVAAAVSTGGLLGLTWWRHRGRNRASRRVGPKEPGAASTSLSRRSPPSTGRAAQRAAMLALVIAVAVVGGVVVARPATFARVTILDVGQGDGILVEGSRGGRLLVDGGPDPDRLLVALDGRVPPWDRRIDTLILTHPHEDHVAGMALLLDRYHVGRVFEPGMVGPGPGYAAWLARLSRTGAPVRGGLAAGDRLQVDEISLRVLWPIRGQVPSKPPDGGTGINNVSVVLLGQVGPRRFLLMGDVEQAIDPQLLAEGLPHVDLLKVAHHGSKTATTQPFVETVRPRVAVASAGTGNPYGHPAKATMDRLAAAGARVLRTDRDGTVVVGFEPSGMTVQTEGGRAATGRPSVSTRAVTLAPAFRCAIPVTALVPEQEPTLAPSPSSRVAEASGRGSAVEYHRGDDGTWAGGGRLPPALPGSARLVRSTRTGRGRGGRLARRPGRISWRRHRSATRRGGGVAARCRQGAAGRRSRPRPPSRRRFGGLADPLGARRARAVGRRSPRHQAPRPRGVPALGRLRDARGADRGVRRQAGGTAAGVDGGPVRVVAAAIRGAGSGWTPSRRGCGRLAGRQGSCRSSRNRRLSRRRCRPIGGQAIGVDEYRAARCQPWRRHPRRHETRMTSPTLAYFWGDDELGAARAVDQFQATLAAETGAPMERWELRGERNRAGELIAQLHERVATPVMFGGGALAVVANPGPLVQSTEHRAGMLAAIASLAPGNGLVLLDASQSGAKAPTQKRLADAVAAAGGTVRKFDSPRRGALAGWIEAEARGRTIQLGAGAAKALAERIGGLVDLNDVERRYQTRIASMELDKLALYRGTAPITADDVRLLVAEAVPASVWAFTDAIGERRTLAAIDLLDRLLDDTPEPVLLAVLHRRIRELLELGDRLATAERLPAAAKAMGIGSDYRAQTLATQAKAWTTIELTAALDGLVELDAMVKGAPGAGQDEAQRRLSFSLWVMDRVARTT